MIYPLKKIVGRIGFWAGWPIIWLILRLGERSRVLVTYGDKVLLVKGTLSSGKWTLPGGGVHRGERAAAAASRELQEETGIKIAPDELVTLGREIAHEDDGLSFMCNYFRAQATGELRVKNSLEILDAKWFDCDDLKNTATQKVVNRAIELWLGR